MQMLIRKRRLLGHSVVLVGSLVVATGLGIFVVSCSEGSTGKAGFSLPQQQPITSVGATLHFHEIPANLNPSAGDYRLVGDFNGWEADSGLRPTKQDGDRLEFDLSSLPNGTHRIGLIRFKAGSTDEYIFGWSDRFGNAGEGFVRENSEGGLALAVQLEGEGPTRAVRPSTGSVVSSAAQAMSFSSVETPTVEAEGLLLSYLPIPSNLWHLDGEFRLVGDFNRWNPVTGIRGTIHGLNVTFNLAPLPNDTYRVALVRYTTGTTGSISYGWVGPYGVPGSGFVKKDTEGGGVNIGLQLVGSVGARTILPASGDSIGIAPSKPLNTPDVGSPPAISSHGTILVYSPPPNNLTGYNGNYRLVGDFNQWKAENGLKSRLANAERIEFDLSPLPDGTYRLALVRFKTSNEADGIDYAWVGPYGDPGDGFVKEDTTQSGGVNVGAKLTGGSTTERSLVPAEGSSIGIQPPQPLRAFFASAPTPQITSSGLALSYTPPPDNLVALKGAYRLVGDFNAWAPQTGLPGMKNSAEVSFDLSSLPADTYRVAVVRYQSGDSGDYEFGWVDPYGSPGTGFVKSDLTQQGGVNVGIQIASGSISPASGTTIGETPTQIPQFIPSAGQTNSGGVAAAVFTQDAFQVTKFKLNGIPTPSGKLNFNVHVKRVTARNSVDTVYIHLDVGGGTQWSWREPLAFWGEGQTRVATYIDLPLPSSEGIHPLSVSLLRPNGKTEVLYQQDICLDGDAPADAEELLKKHKPIFEFHLDETKFPIGVEKVLTTPGELVTYEDPFVATLFESRAVGDSLRELLSYRGSKTATFRFDGKSLSSPAAVVYGAASESGGQVFLQYWLFYSFDPKGVFLAKAFAPHNGDWEVVTIKLERSGVSAIPKEVGYGAHVDGQTITWECRTDKPTWYTPGCRLPWSEIDRVGDNPIVYVAKGSHACYPKRGAYDLRIGHRALPDELKLGPFGEEAGGISNLRPDYELRVLPRHSSGLPAISEWLRFSGAWGKNVWYSWAKMLRGPSFQTAQGYGKWSQARLYLASLDNMKGRLGLPNLEKIRVNYPNGGETLRRGEMCKVRWKTDLGFYSKLRVHVYKGGEICGVLGANETDDGVLDFIPTQEFEDGDDYQIAISAVANDSYWDYSDCYFSISN